MMAIPKDLQCWDKVRVRSCNAGMLAGTWVIADVVENGQVARLRRKTEVKIECARVSMKNLEKVLG